MECPIIAEVWPFRVPGKYLRTFIKMPIILPDLGKFSLGSSRCEALGLQCFGNHCRGLAFYHCICWNGERRYFIFLSIFSFACPPVLICIPLNVGSIASEVSLLISFETSLTQIEKANNDKMSKINLGSHHGILSNRSFQSPRWGRCSESGFITCSSKEEREKIIFSSKIFIMCSYCVCVCVWCTYIHILVSPTEISQRFLLDFMLPSIPIKSHWAFYLPFSLSDTRMNLNSSPSPITSLMYLLLFTFPFPVESDGNSFRAFSFPSKSKTFVLLIELSFISISNPKTFLEIGVLDLRGSPATAWFIKLV